MHTEPLNDKEAYSKIEAAEWLTSNITAWPEYMDSFATGRMVANWRFVDTLPDREIVFANGLQPAITKAEWIELMWVYHGPYFEDTIH